MVRVDEESTVVLLHPDESEESASGVAYSCLTLCDPMDCSSPRSFVHGLLQARVPEWVAISSSRGSSQPKDGTQVSRTAGRCFTLWASREAECCQPPRGVQVGWGGADWDPSLRLPFLCVRGLESFPDGSFPGQGGCLVADVKTSWNVPVTSTGCFSMTESLGSWTLKALELVICGIVAFCCSLPWWPLISLEGIIILSVEGSYRHLPSGINAEGPDPGPT